MLKKLHKYWPLFPALLIMYSIIFGLTVSIPETPIEETMRNVFFHVPMWFTMIFLFSIALLYSLLLFLKAKESYLNNIITAIETGLVFGLCGIITGMIWAKATWGGWWMNDPKLNGALISMLLYGIYYFIYKSLLISLKFRHIFAIYNIVSYSLTIFLIMILPRLSESSIHPGHGGNPALNPAHMDASMKFVFIPAIIGWELWGTWLYLLNKKSAQIEVHFSKIV